MVSGAKTQKETNFTTCKGGKNGLENGVLSFEVTCANGKMWFILSVWIITSPHSQINCNIVPLIPLRERRIRILLCIRQFKGGLHLCNQLQSSVLLRFGSGFGYRDENGL